MSAHQVPKRVVVVDADNPLVEIQGEFFWRADHEAIVERERAAAYAAGYGDALAAANGRPVEVVVRHRRARGRLLTRLLLALVAIAFLAQLASNALR